MSQQPTGPYWFQIRAGNPKAESFVPILFLIFQREYSKMLTLGMAHAAPSICVWEGDEWLEVNLRVAVRGFWTQLMIGGPVAMNWPAELSRARRRRAEAFGPMRRRMENRSSQPYLTIGPEMTVRAELRRRAQRSQTLRLAPRHALAVGRRLSAEAPRAV